MFPGRTDAIELAKIVELDPALQVNYFIDFANELVTEVCATAVKSDGVTLWHNEYRLTRIELLLSAHFYCVEDARAKSERVGPIKVENQSKVDTGLDVTHYGQQAKILDTSGKLGILDKAIKDGRQPFRIKLSLKWLGTRHYNFQQLWADRCFEQFWLGW